MIRQRAKMYAPTSINRSGVSFLLAQSLIVQMLRIRQSLTTTHVLRLVNSTIDGTSAQKDMQAWNKISGFLDTDEFVGANGISIC